MHWELPPSDLLNPGESDRTTNESANVAAMIDGVFATYGVNAVVADFVRGATVTRYDVLLDDSTPVAKVERLRKDIALKVGTDNVRIISPIAHGVVGIEIPNNDRDSVALRECLATMDDDAPVTTTVIGESIDGRTLSADISKWPHILVAGATGSGKSVFINALIMSLIMRATPDQLRLVLIDPKQVELSCYEGLPHLARPIVTDPEEATNVLAALTELMDVRYAALKNAGVRNIAAFNERFPDQAMPYMVVVIDEMADLMLIAGADVEDSVMRLGQLARAAGIHLVLATQRPSADIIKGKIKANVPSRLSFSVASGTDSRVILDANGAQSLLGMGDGLYLPIGASEPMRIQSAWVSDSEIAAVVGHWRAQVAAPVLPPVPQPPTPQQGTQGATGYTGRHRRQSVRRHHVFALLGLALLTIVKAIALVCTFIVLTTLTVCGLTAGDRKASKNVRRSVGYY